MAHPKEEQTLIIIKPDAIHRGLLGQIMSRFERKGLKIIGMKMIEVSDALVNEHYGHHKEKPFFASLKGYMQSTPVVVVALAGINAVNATRLIVGPTAGHAADAGSIRGDFAMSTQSNLVHASDSVENGQTEIARFFSSEELFDYQRNDFAVVYSDASE
jgi:nucleoside-diphosphate kinase